jgi:hypothetical protein
VQGPVAVESKNAESLGFIASIEKFSHLCQLETIS